MLSKKNLDGYDGYWWILENRIILQKSVGTIGFIWFFWFQKNVYFCSFLCKSSY